MHPLLSHACESWLCELRKREGLIVSLAKWNLPYSSLSALGMTVFDCRLHLAHISHCIERLRAPFGRTMRKNSKSE
ncbi:hypothetical protein XENTR_v10004025 [Xenopus tropicalis]|nr:hypothetical protein XENTR_v10004025 [Xenopus tropicalis]